MYRNALAGLFVALAMTLGCGGGPGAVPVEGVVTLDGAPLPNATVALMPLTAANPGPFSGVSDSTGKFTLGTPDGSGAAPGEYYVNITTVQGGAGIEGAPPPTQKEVVPVAYRNSSMKFTVPQDGTNAANFDLKSK